MIDMEPKLTTILEMVNDWLKFAEAKNFGLLAFCGAVIVAITSFLFSTTKFSTVLLISLVIVVMLLSVSCLFVLISFLPRINLPKVLTVLRHPPEDTDNFYFFGHLCKYRPDQLTDAIARLYFNERNYSNARIRSDLDIATQIVVNSTIAMYKYWLFSVALRIAILAVLIVPIIVVLYFIFL